MNRLLRFTGLTATFVTIQFTAQLVTATLVHGAAQVGNLMNCDATPGHMDSAIIPLGLDGGAMWQYQYGEDPDMSGQPGYPGESQGSGTR